MCASHLRRANVNHPLSSSCPCTPHRQTPHPQQSTAAATRRRGQRRDDCCFVGRTGLAVSDIDLLSTGFTPLWNSPSRDRTNSPRQQSRILPMRFNLQLQTPPASCTTVKAGSGAIPAFAWKDAGVQKREYHNLTGGQVPEPVRRGVGGAFFGHIQLLLELLVSNFQKALKHVAHFFLVLLAVSLYCITA